MAACDKETCTQCAANGCPFAFTDKSEMIQNYGCLPTPMEIITMRVAHGKTWACHSNPDKPCLGAIEYLQRHRFPHAVIDPELITEADDWTPYSDAQSVERVRLSVSRRSMQNARKQLAQNEQDNEREID